MDIIRVFASEFSFKPMTYEHHFLLPDSNREFLKDVKLKIHGNPAFEAPQRWTSPHDIRLYIDGLEITEYFLEELRSQANSIDEDIFTDQYKKGIDDWINMASKLGLAYGRDLEVDKEYKVEILAVEPKDMFDQLGNLSAGNSGFLHVFNFLYDFIDFPSVSMNNVFKRLVEDQGEDVIDRDKLSRLTISNGKSRFHSEDWTIPQSVGTIRLQCEMVYHNPLEDEIKELKKKINELELAWEEDLLEILDRLSPDGELVRSISRTQNSLEKTTINLTALKAEIDSLKLQVVEFEETSRELKDAVRAL